MPGESLHAAAPSQCLVIIITIIIINIIIIILLIITIIIRLEIQIFRLRASIGTAKRDIGVCANTDRVFPPYDACVGQRIPPNGYLNGLSDEQPWTSWGALFSDPVISALLWMSSSMPPQVNSRHTPCASLHAAAPSQCLIISIILIILIIIIIIIRLEIRIFRHPFSKYPTVRWKWQVRASIRTAKRDIGVCANTDRVFFPRTMRVSDNVYLQMAI